MKKSGTLPRGAPAAAGGGEATLASGERGIAPPRPERTAQRSAQRLDLGLETETQLAHELRVGCRRLTIGDATPARSDSTAQPLRRGRVHGLRERAEDRHVAQRDPPQVDQLVQLP